MRRAAKIAIALGAMLVCGGVIAVAVNRSDKGEAFDIEKVTREHSRKASRAKPGLRPTPGTYTYSGSGNESVTVLGGSKHRLPAKVAATVELKGGCEWTLSVLYLKEHTTTERYCTDAAGTRLLETTDEVTFFGVADVAGYRCGKPSRKGKSRTGLVCSSYEGVKRRIHRDERLQAPTTMRVGDQDVTVTELSLRTRYEGHSRGTQISTLQLMASGLPVSFSHDAKLRSGTVFGDTSYRFHAGYVLDSIEPD